ncbi:MarR family transcriptional regulator [Candidatus Woesearchaeota archaeon]|nr:MAG: MarR family transcriptional regulator [Candidatus Woesearchaeota archaeon]
MKNKYVGMLVISIALVFLIIVISFNKALEKIVSTTCTHGPACPMYITLETQQIISYSLIGLLIVIGIIMMFFLKEKPKEKVKVSNVALSDEENNIINILKKEHGSIYQSDIIKETGLSKVKVTRILDKLEGKKLIERKRRGMTNIIILK